MKRKLHSIIYQNEVFINSIYCLIILNVVCLILESYKSLYWDYKEVFQFIEFISISIFTLEYLIRLWVADIGTKNHKESYSNRTKYALSGYGIIDLISIVPFYLPLLIPFDLRVIRILRVFRIVRILKLGRYSKAIRTINIIIKETKPELLITAFVAFILLIISSTLMFYVENQAQPDKFANIGEAFWWAISTLTGIGYSDFFPVTSLGKSLSAVMALTGIGFIALPAGIISSAFIEKLQAEKDNKVCKCPSCGTDLNI
ncbi:ion transporter [uncultured Aquimarina sp.]|uniref:ion transporter n=1 Tax=uncultured Aquimarina sp. TaxID=575652 RepID=UPI00260FF671|nr:ion transporter [uncultured Aquimarina sp.]